MEYTTIHSFNDLGKLIEMVNELISKGWKPIGGINSLYCETNPNDERITKPEIRFMQSMIIE